MKEAEATVSDILREIRSRFAGAKLDDPALDARTLVAGLLGVSKTELLMRTDETVEPQQRAMIEQAVQRRLAHEPVHRILGERAFYGLSLKLSPDTLEPRPDTEILVDTVLPYAHRLVTAHGNIHILDIGTGTGAICLALLQECPDALGTGSDISAGALKIAEENAEKNGLERRFRSLQSNWFETIQDQFHVIVSNPPYIASSVISNLAPEVKNFDPSRALDGGIDGLDAYRSIAKDAARFLHRDGIVGLEIGYDQRAAVTAIFEASHFHLLEAVRDYGQNDRVLVFACNG